MKTGENKPNTPTVDLFAPVNHFVAASRLHGRLHRWLLLFRRYWWLLVLILAAVLGPAYWLTALSGPAYESRARMWVTGKINVAESWSYTEELVNFLGTQAALLQSPAIQSRAMAKLRSDARLRSDLAGIGAGNSRNLLGEAKELWHKLLRANPNTESNSTPLIPFQVKVLEGSKSSTLELRATGPNPVSTRKFLDCLMDEYLSFKRESRDQASGQASASLTAEAARLKSELVAAREKLQAFQASNSVVILQQQGSGAESYLASLNRQLAILRTEQKLLESLKPEQWAEAGVTPGSAGQASGDEATARQLLASLAQSQAALFQADQQMHLLMARRDELGRFLRPAHPKIFKLNQDIATQEQIVQVARDEASKQLTLRRQAVEAQIQNLEAASEEWNAKAIVAGRRVAEHDQLLQNEQRIQAAYDKTLGLIQNLDVANRVEQENVGILDPASGAKLTHRRFLNLAVAGAFALALGFGLLYGIALFQDDFASHTELAEQLAEPVVGQIPSIVFKGSNKPLDLEGMEKQRFEFLEAFRNIRASLLFTNNGGTRPKTLVITSSIPGEGKSTVALYLAATLAKAGMRVLLIDADMRRPSLHKYFGLSNSPGLAELLGEKLSSVHAIFPAGVDNLALLPAGVAKENPGDLVLSPVWPALLASVKSQFDYVLVDTPPVAATDDAAALAHAADGVLFVVRALSTSARVARSVLDGLRQRQVHMVGLIFNGAVSSPCERQYYQPYERAYRWEPGRTGLAEPAGQRLLQPAETVKAANGHE